MAQARRSLREIWRSMGGLSGLLNEGCQLGDKTFSHLEDLKVNHLGRFRVLFFIMAIPVFYKDILWYSPLGGELVVGLGGFAALGVLAMGLAFYNSQAFSFAVQTQEAFRSKVTVNESLSFGLVHFVFPIVPIGLMHFMGTHGVMQIFILLFGPYSLLLQVNGMVSGQRQFQTIKLFQLLRILPVYVAVMLVLYLRLLVAISATYLRAIPYIFIAQNFFVLALYVSLLVAPGAGFVSPLFKTCIVLVAFLMSYYCVMLVNLRKVPAYTASFYVVFLSHAGLINFEDSN